MDVANLSEKQGEIKKKKTKKRDFPTTSSDESTVSTSESKSLEDL